MAAALADVAVPVSGTVEVAGPDAVPLDELVDRSRRDNPHIGPTRFEEWLSHSIPQMTGSAAAQNYPSLFLRTVVPG